jgi:hypothetical protein
MKKIILISTLCTLSCTILSMELSTPKGITKPKDRLQQQREDKRTRAQRIVNILNIALHYSSLASDEIKESLELNDFATQALLAEQSNGQALRRMERIQWKENCLYNDRLCLLEFLEKTQQDIVDTAFDIALSTQPQSNDVLSEIPIDVETDNIPVRKSLRFKK